jgi:hypothetical protein
MDAACALAPPIKKDEKIMRVVIDVKTNPS